MERGGIYRKGRAGHVRNINSYLLAKQHYKKWRVPITGFLALVFVFALAPAGGENFQASVLTTESLQKLSETSPAQARKNLMGALKDFLKDCKRFTMKECVQKGESIMRDIANSNDGDLSRLLPSIANFEDEFEAEVVRRACVYDVGKAAEEAKNLRSSLRAFQDTYGDETLSVKQQISSLESVVSGLGALVSQCRSR